MAYRAQMPIQHTAPLNLISGFLAAALAVAGFIHCLLMPTHFRESTLLGIGFMSAGVVQLGLAGLVVLRPRRAVFVAIIISSVVLIGLYTFNVVIGLPFDSSGTAAGVHADGDDHVAASEGAHAATDDHGASPSDDHGASASHDAAGVVEDHGTGIALGAGEPVDAAGAATQAAQVAAIVLAVMALRRRTRSLGIAHRAPADRV